MHPGISVGKLQSHQPDQQATLRTAMNGTFFTADKLAKRNPAESSKCKFCGEEDSQLHRHWRCSHFDSCRAHMTADQIQAVIEMPPAISNHGWMPTPPSLHKFREACMQIPDETATFVLPRQMEDLLVFFTDGSCLDPTSPFSKLASWGVVLGSTDEDAFHPISHGLCPGWMQTAARAEILAVLSAFDFALRFRKPCSIWVDNDRVFKKLHSFMLGKFRIGTNQKDADLWEKLADRVARLGPLIRHVGKVVSHQNLDKAIDEAEAWVMRGNAAADATANAAFARFPTQLGLWNKLRDELACVCILRENVHKVLLSVAAKAFRHEGPQESNTDEAQPRIGPDQVQVFRAEPLDSAWNSKRFAIAEMEEIVRWFQTLGDATAPPKMISWFQLNVLFEHQLGFTVRYKPSSKRYFLEKNHKADFAKRSNHFSRWTQGVFGPTNCRVLHLRPTSTCLKFWTMCIPMCLLPGVHDLMEQLLGQHQRSFSAVGDLKFI